MTCQITKHRTIGRPLYEAVIRKGPEVLWSMTDHSEIKVYAEAQREMNRLEAGR